MIQIPVGIEYLEIQADDDQLEEKLLVWYNNPINMFTSCLGTIKITTTKTDYSKNPRIPTVEWEEDRFSFCAFGCIGMGDLSGISRLEINNPFKLFYIEQFIRVVTAVEVFKKGGFLVHSAGLIKGGKGYLFSGNSGAGKTTICRITKDCEVLNDDLVILYPDNENWIICSTPFTNPTQVKPGIGKGRLDKVIHLKQANQHKVRDLSFHEALAVFMSHLPVISLAPQFSTTLFERCVDIIQKAVVKELSFLPDDGFWRLLEPES